MNIQWDEKKYADDFNFVPQYGEAVLDLITLPKGSFAVDLGCGNGVLTVKLTERGYDVLGIDDSAAASRYSIPERECADISPGSTGRYHFL